MNPTTFDELRDAILSWVADITGRDIVLANSGEGPKPRVPYAEIFITEYSVPATQVSTLEGDGTQEQVTSNTLLSIQLDLFGSNPMQDTSKLMRSLFSARRYLDLWQICGLSGADDIRDLTALETGAMKQRAQATFRVYCQLVNNFTSDFAETLPISVDVPDKNYTEIAPGGEDPREKAGICFT